MTTALFTGFGLGFLVAAQVGPVWLLAARSVILGRLITGIMIGLGAATIDMAYGALGLAGAASLLRIPGLHLGLGLAGAAVLTALGALALRHAIQAGGQPEPPAPVTSAPRAYLTALAATAPNPLTIASWAAVFAAASTARITHTTTAAVLLLAGIGLGTATWFTALSTAMTLVRRLAGRRVHQAITVISGLGLIAFGIILAWHTAAAPSQ
jgi:threonine/homoserine/homoserine lactone efflux protein